MPTYVNCVVFSGLLSISDPDMTSEDLVLFGLARINGDLAVSGCSVLSLLRLPSLVVVTGDVTIENNPLISSLLPLNLTVGGSVKIINNAALSSLDGLSQSVWTGGFFIESNRNLVSLAPLTFTSITGSLRIVKNAQFSSLQGLQTLLEVGNVYIQSCPLLTSLEFLPALPVYGTLTLIDLPALVNISALSPLRQVRGIMFRDLPLLKDVSPLSSLTSVKAFLSLIKIGKLQTLTGFNAVTEIDAFNVIQCLELTHIEGFHSASSMPNNFMVVGNPELVEIAAFDGIRRVHTFTVAGNSKLVKIAGFNQLTDVGSTQISNNPELADIDFMSGVTIVNGSLTVLGNNMTNLQGLRSIEKVDGDFAFNNEQTEDLNFIGALRRVSKRLILAHNSVLTSVKGFANLTYAGTIEVNDNPLLENLAGFERVSVGALHILDCPLLQDVSAFVGTTRLDRLQISRCANLSSLTGFANLERVTYDMDLSTLPQLSLQLPALKSVAQIYINKLPMENLNGLKALQSAEYLTAYFNPNLVEISALCNMSYLAGFSIKGSPLLCCSSVLRSLSYARSGLNDTDFWAYSLKDCANSCQGPNALSCPCSPTMQRCLNGGTCTTTPTSFECACATGYKGEVCQIAVPMVTSANPQTVDHSGKAVIVVRGIRLPERPVCTFGGLVGETLYTTPPTPTVVYCVAPPDHRNDSYYADLVVYNQYSRDEASDPRKLIYYTDIMCPVPSTVLRLGMCAECPDGGWCDDRRVWPRKDYWSESEDTDPVRCWLALACPGALGEVDGYPPQLLPDGRRVTQMCARGYTGVACGKCAANFNQGIYGACIPCLLDAAGLAEVSGTIIFAVILFAVLAVAVATLEEEKMAVVATILMGVQRAMATGQLCATRYGGETLNGVFASLSFFNFDMQFVKPGCAVSALDFEGVFWSTIAIAVLAAMFFVLGAFVRSRIVSDAQLATFGKIEEQERSRTPTAETKGRTPSISAERKDRSRSASNGDVRSRRVSNAERLAVELAEVSRSAPEPINTEDSSPVASTPPPLPRADTSIGRKKHVFTRSALFRRRAVHSLIMLGLLIHFQICLRCFQGLVCDERAVPGGGSAYFLRAAVDKPCYEGPYVGTMFFIWVMFLVYIVGFPVWCFLQVYKVRKQGELKISLAKTQRFGFLYRELKEEFFWFRSSAFVVNFLLAIFSTTIHVGEVQTFLNALVFLVYIEAIIFLRPFMGARNVVPAALGMAGLVINVISLILGVQEHASFYSSYLFALIVLGVITASGAHVALKLRAHRLKTTAGALAR